MLAYVFWHWPSPSVSVAGYELLQREFHAALATAAPAGFVRSCVYRIGGKAPWLSENAAATYADWYLLESSAAIDAFNVAAVSGVCTESHAAVAHAMGAGAGSLFNLRTGSPNLDAARIATFLTKPRPAMSYDEFDAAVSAVRGSDSASVWRRALVLGPNPEFLVLSASELAFASELQPLTLTLAAL
jgi:hypothetical protein